MQLAHVGSLQAKQKKTYSPTEIFANYRKQKLYSTPFNECYFLNSHRDYIQNICLLYQNL